MLAPYAFCALLHARLLRKHNVISRDTIGDWLQHHPFSGLIDSAGEL